MKVKYIQHTLLSFLFFSIFWIAGCQSSTPTEGSAETETRAYRSHAPDRVDIRGSIIMRRYNEGQVVLEVEGFGTTQDSRYNRAYVLVLPTTQIVDEDGRSISLNELQQGQHVAVLLRGGGQGNFVGVGVARKLWLEELN